MQEERLEYKRIVSDIKLKKIAIICAFAVVAVLSLLFLGDFHYYNGLEEKGIGLSLHPLIVLVVIIIEGICAVLLFSKAEKSADRIIDVDCDPMLYYQVRKALMSRRDRDTVLPIIEVRTAYYLGDFAKCAIIASRIAEFSGNCDRLYGLSYLALASFFLKDKNRFEIALRDFKRLLERSDLKMRSPIRRDMDRRQNALEMLALCFNNDAENAVLYADSLIVDYESVSTIEKLNILYLRALVYDAFGKNKKALDCFEKCREIKNKTFIAERLEDNN